MADRVLITGARAVAALDLARALRAAGFEPHLADCSPARLARWSSGAGPVHRYASPVGAPAAFARDVVDLVERLDPIAVLPVCEEVFHLAALARDRGFADRLLAPTPEVLAVLHHKGRFAALCRDLSLDAPETVEVADREALEAFAETAADHVFKPAWSRFGGRTLVAPPAAALAGIAPTPDDPWIVQRRIVGDEVSAWAMCREGRVVAFAAYRSDWRLAGGAAIAFQPATADLAARLRQAVEALAGFAGTGQVALDAIVDGDGRPWLIECNPRATSGVHLFGRSAGLGRALLGRDEAGPDDDARHLTPALWRFGLPMALRERRLAEWSRQRRAGRDVLGAPGDSGPLFGALADTLDFGWKALVSGQSLTSAMTADIEWNGAPLDAARWRSA